MSVSARALIIAAAILSILSPSAVATGRAATGRACDGTWHVVSSPNAGVTNYLYGMAAIDDANVWAVGYELPQAGSFYRPLAMHWDGQSWTVVPAPTIEGGNTDLLAIAGMSSTDVWAVGSSFNTNGTQQHPLIEHWDGSAWAIVPNKLPGYSGGLVDVTVVGTDDVWAVGSMTRIGDSRSLVLAEHWDGTMWTAVRTPNDAPLNRYGLAAAALDASRAWLAGVVSDGSTDRLLTDRWNGLRWAAVPAPNVPASSFEDVRSMSGSASAGVWIVGGYVANPPVRVPLTVRWNGSAWDQIPTPAPPSWAILTELNGVAAPAATDAWAVGFAWNSHSEVYILHWDGAAWTEIPHPQVSYGSSDLEAVSAASQMDLWAAGYGEVGDASYTLIEHRCV